MRRSPVVAPDPNPSPTSKRGSLRRGAFGREIAHGSGGGEGEGEGARAEDLPKTVWRRLYKSGRRNSVLSSAGSARSQVGMFVEP